MNLDAKRQIPIALSLAVFLLSACGWTHTYTIGGTVTGLVAPTGPLSIPLVLQNNGADNLTISTNGPFTFPAPVTADNTTSASYNVTVLSQPIGQTCNVTGGSGTASSNVTSVIVSCSSGSGRSSASAAYVVNESGGTVSQYPIGANGTLPTTAASIVATGKIPYAIAIDPLGRFAYVANNGAGTVSEYIVASSGVLALNNTIADPTATVPEATKPVSIAVDQSGQHVYVVNAGTNPGSISQYTINSDGTLTAFGSPALTGNTPNSITIDPLGRFAYVVNFGDGTISEYTINAGALTLAATVAAPLSGNNKPASVAVDPSGSYVYVANNGSGTVSAYSIGTGGLLTLIGSVPAGANPISITVDPAGLYVYVANNNTNGAAGSVSEYSIVAGGGLAAIGTIGAGFMPSCVTVDSSGQYAYVANLGDGTISQYTIISGVLTTPSSVTSVGGQPVAIVTTP